jgi:hypothetical protein
MRDSFAAKGLGRVQAQFLALLAILPLLSAALAHAQESPAQAIPEAYDGVKDPALKAAFDDYRALEGRVPPAMKRQMMKPQEIQAWLAEPENFTVILKALDGVAGAGPEDLKVLMGSNYTRGVVKVAILSGRAEALPALKKLAWSEEQGVRDEVALLDHYVYLDPQPADLLLEVVKSAESRLPKDFAPGQENARQYWEFEDLVRSVYQKLGDTGRGELRSIMKRVLARSRGAEVHRQFEEKFEQIQQMPRSGSGRLMTGSGKGAAGEAGTTEQVESRSALPMVVTLGVLCVVAAGMAWWLLRGRRRNGSAAL